MVTKRALVLIAKGVEELEFIASVDVLRRGEVNVTVAGVTDENTVKCSRDVLIKPDIALSAAQSPYDVIVLPGGLGAAKVFSESQEVGKLLNEQECAGRWIAAICAAPTALKAHGIALGKSITSYPTMQSQLESQYNYKQDNVVVDGNVITSRGPGTAMVFALTVLDCLAGKDKAQEVAQAMLTSYL